MGHVGSPSADAARAHGPAGAELCGHRRGPQHIPGSIRPLQRGSEVCSHKRPVQANLGGREQVQELVPAVLPAPRAGPGPMRVGPRARRSPRVCDVQQLADALRDGGGYRGLLRQEAPHRVTGGARINYLAAGKCPSGRSLLLCRIGLQLAGRRDRWSRQETCVLWACLECSCSRNTGSKATCRLQAIPMCPMPRAVQD